MYYLRSLKRAYTVENVFDYDAFWNFPIEIWEEPNSYIEYRNIPIKPRGLLWIGKLKLYVKNEVCTTIVIIVIVATPDVALSSEDGNIDGVQQTSTAGSMTRFLPIDGYLYTINFNELVLFQIGSDYRPSPWIKKNTKPKLKPYFN